MSLASHLGSKPKRALAIILTVVVAVVILSAMLALGLPPFAKAPYPNDKLPMELDHDSVLYTQPVTFMIQNGSGVTPYSWMKMLFRAASDGSSITMPTQDFQNQVIMNSSWTVVTMSITDKNGDGGFDEGDTLLFEFAPMGSDMIFTVGLVWPDHDGGGATTEFSFVVHHGKLYSWYSDYLGDDWYWPFLTQ